MYTHIYIFSWVKSKGVEQAWRDIAGGPEMPSELIHWKKEEHDSPETFLGKTMFKVK